MHPEVIQNRQRRRGIARSLALGMAVQTAFALPFLLSSGNAQAQSSSPSPLAQRLADQGLSAEGLTLDFPALADTGNAVPLRVEVQAPAGLTLTALEVILPENPNPSVVQLRLIEPLPHYVFSTRMRLAASQDAWVIATFSDGSQRAASAPTIVTSSACFDGT